MIEILPESRGKKSGIRATGRLTDHDYKTVLIPRLEAIIREEGNARVLIHMNKWEMESMWGNMQFG